jgi:HCOMODA/2-hydroxy-3-carboxy-muconic semialdehyde decarboxylase
VNEAAVQVADTARMLAAAGLVEAFGHVSMRLDESRFLITSTLPMLEASAETILTVDVHGEVLDDPVGAAPLEIPLHAAVYSERSDVNAVCRGHGRAMVAWGVTENDIPLLHGLGAIAGTTIPVHADLDLISSAESASSVAATLGAYHCALLKGNGGFAVGADLLEAATRLWFLEERAQVALAAPTTRPPEGDWPHRLTHSAVELVRAMAWFKSRFSDSH